jgi:formylglycine-generating enzyme required for sulfatase activity
MDNLKREVLNKPYRLLCVLALLACVCTEIPENCGNYALRDPFTGKCGAENYPDVTAKFTLTVNHSGGTVKVNGANYTGPVSVSGGMAVGISASESSGYGFDVWRGTSGAYIADTVAKVTIVTLSEDAEVTAVFTWNGTTPPGGGEKITQTVNGYTFEMSPVAGGTFTMGCTDEECYDWEKPAHSVTLSSYYIGKYEVTQGLWKAVMGSNNNPSYFSGNDNLPVESVSWNTIVNEFIPKLNQQTGRTYRLPTEAEWEYAARGGNKSVGYKYSGSNTLGSVAWYWENSDSKTHPVGGKAPNELGIYDMSGNVWEWVSDWYDGYSSSAQTNPTGPTTGSYRVRRGGGWDYVEGYCRVSNRIIIIPGDGYSNLGFRLVLPSP